MAVLGSVSSSTPAPLMAEVVENFSAVLSRLDNLFGGFNTRLKPIVREGGDKEPSPTMIVAGWPPLHASLRDLYNQMNQTLSDFEDLLSRIEV